MCERLLKNSLCLTKKYRSNTGWISYEKHNKFRLIIITVLNLKFSVNYY